MNALFPKFRSKSARCLANGALFAALALLGSTAVAQMQQPADPSAVPGHASPLMQQIAAKQAEIQQLNAELEQIQVATMEANPELEAQRDEFVSLVDAKMAEAGHDPAASRDRMEAMQGQLQGDTLSEAERQEVGQKLRQEMNTLQQAQSQALQGDDVRAAGQMLNNDLMAAMEKQNPQTAELIAQLQAAQQEFQQLVSQARQQQLGEQPPGS